MSFIDKILGSDDTFSLEARCLNAIILVSIYISLMSALVDVIQNYNSYSYVFSGGMAIVFSVLYYLGLKKKAYKYLVAPYIFIQLVPITFIWYLYDGLSGPSIIFWLCFIIAVPVITRGALRFITLGSFIAIISILFILETVNPDIVRGYAAEDMKLTDIYTTAVIFSIGIVMVIFLILHSYNKQRMLSEVNSNIKDRLFSIITHDLRGPLGTINGFINVVSDTESDVSQEDRDNYLRIINETSEKTYTLLENLLDWSRLLRSDLETNPCILNLKEVTDRTLDLLNAGIQRKKLNVVSEIHEDDYVFADYNMTWTIMRNLISNAMKFTEQGGEISITLEKFETRVKVSVKDSGVGLSESERQKILHEPVIKSTEGTNKEMGTGFGLKICKEFIYKNNGEFFIESNKNSGSVFSFTLPSS